MQIPFRNSRMMNLGTYDNREEEEEDSLKCGATLKSRRGTVRGVKNRVRQGIATFLKDKSKKVGDQRYEITLSIDYPILTSVAKHSIRPIRFSLL